MKYRNCRKCKLRTGYLYRKAIRDKNPNYKPAMSKSGKRNIELYLTSKGKSRYYGRITINKKRYNTKSFSSIRQASAALNVIKKAKHEFA